MSDSETSSGTMLEQRVVATAETATRTIVDVRNHEFVIDEPQSGGGTNQGPSPVETMLAAQAGCLNVVGNKVANDMDAEITIREVEIDGSLDLDKVNGRSDDPRAGVQHVDVSIRIDTEVDEETIRTWAEQTEERCPVTDNLVEETSCEVSITAK